MCSFRVEESILSINYYKHPILDVNALSAQQMHDKISGKSGIYYCGAYWFNCFHEDGVNSAIRVCQDLGVSV